MISSPTPQNINKAAHIIKNGGLIAYPTETVYGLGADPHNVDAIAKIFSTKGREENKGIILLIRDQSDLPTLVETVTPTAQTLIDAFWPGPLTLIFKALPSLPSALTGGLDTIALRHSSSPITTQLLNALRTPITSTSANRSGTPPCTSAHDVQNTLGDHLDFILDGGTSPDTLPSTLVDVSTNQAILLREGALPLQSLTQYLPIQKK